MHHGNLDPDLQQFRAVLATPDQPPRRRAPILIGLAIAALLAASAWWWHGNQPITPDQRATLSGLVGETHRKTGESRQKIWEQLKIQFGIRRIDQLRRRDYPDARQHLTPAARR